MSYLSPYFFIGNIRIGSVENASCVNLGNNLPHGFESHQKNNQGLGNVYGDGNTLKDLRSLLSDSAILDMLSHQKDEPLPEWMEKIIEEQMKKAAQDSP
ncbi:hypothetical protein [Halobacillus mangrovi]|uniref:Uncharacterized protein n=1 Tax=Halobacillus mangrovi TaxID=402384 RepID=A0A1W5ZS18_9BACI|nr:hypothetical protein [Halobacillus mangrovi]ARI76110.1 hypothetical protein HM131_04335 [Halobacillus mangrovi]